MSNETTAVSSDTPLEEHHHHDPFMEKVFGAGTKSEEFCEHAAEVINHGLHLKDDSNIGFNIVDFFIFIGLVVSSFFSVLSFTGHTLSDLVGGHWTTFFFLIAIASGMVYYKYILDEPEKDKNKNNNTKKRD